MNSQKILDLLLDGAYLNSTEYKFYHPSFRKGWRKMSSNNISFSAAESKLRKMNRLDWANTDQGIIIKATAAI
jgi:hypothetical protein